MAEFFINNEVNELTEQASKIEKMDFSFEAELNSKYEEYTNGRHSFTDFQKDKEELLQIREELLKYKELLENDSSDEDDPEKVLKLVKHR